MKPLSKVYSLLIYHITGWSTVNAIVGGQALRAVAIDSNLPKMPIEVAIIIIAVLTFAFSFMGCVVRIFANSSK